jgi:hypothetical protein
VPSREAWRRLPCHPSLPPPLPADPGTFRSCIVELTAKPTRSYRRKPERTLPPLVSLISGSRLSPGDRFCVLATRGGR